MGRCAFIRMQPVYMLCAIASSARSASQCSLPVRHQVVAHGQVPKIGRRFVKPEDIAFIDITEYTPRSQTTSPYHMKIKSILPLLGDRVGQLILEICHAL